MCGRFFLDAKNREIDRLLEQLPQSAHPVKLGEIFPTDWAMTLVWEKDRICPEAMIWGFPRYKAKGVIFNARSETVLEKPMFAGALRRHPAVVPVNGFFEWHKVGTTKQKDKLLFSNPDGQLLYLAACWNAFAGENGELLSRFTIITTAANDSMAFCHDRMPLLILRDDLLAWLKGENLEGFLKSIPFTLVCKKED